MRFLADAGISPKTVEFLTQLGHEAIHVRTLGLQRAADVVLVERARGDILALGVLDKPSVIIFRLTERRGRIRRLSATAQVRQFVVTKGVHAHS